MSVAVWASLRNSRPTPSSTPDDVTLSQRVRSIVLRRLGLSHGALNIDAHDGVVTLRGALPDAALAHRIET